MRTLRKGALQENRPGDQAHAASIGGFEDSRLGAAIEDAVSNLQAVISSVGYCGERGLLTVHARAHCPDVALPLQVMQDGCGIRILYYLDRRAVNHHHVDEVGL